MSMKRHLEYYTHPDKSLKDRSRFWLWNMRGLHGDMDTRYEGDRRLSKDRAVPASSATSPLNFRPVSSETYGYNPRGVNVASRPPPVPEADKPRARDFSIPSKNLDDLMLLREPRRSSSLPRSAAADDDYRPLLPSRLLRHLPIDADLDGLLKRLPLWPRRGIANRLWRPNLFLDDTALLKPRASWLNDPLVDPWWHKYPELRPLDLATSWKCGPPSMRNSYLSPVKRTYLWRSAHPLRPYGK